MDGIGCALELRKGQAKGERKMSPTPSLQFPLRSVDSLFLFIYHKTVPLQIPCSLLEP